VLFVVAVLYCLGCPQVARDGCGHQRCCTAGKALGKPMVESRVCYSP